MPIEQEPTAPPVPVPPGFRYPVGESHCESCGQPVGAFAIDRLTGLYDRWGWDDRAPRVLRAVRQRQEPAALLMMDLDHFKSVNDQFGHLAGDTVLRAVANVLREATRADDVVGRYGGHGGDEFLALLPGTDRDRALIVATRIRETVKSLQVTVPDAGSRLRATLTGQTVSIGIALYRPRYDDATNLDDLVLDADAALLMAKREGRDRIHTLSRP